MKKNLTRKLTLNKTTVAVLNQKELNEVKGRYIAPPKTEAALCTCSCTCTCQQLEAME